MPPFYHESMPNTSGIYRITCVVTGKIYIGSAINLRQRCRNHFSALRRNNHINKKLQHAWNKYGSDAFTFEVLELVLPMSLTAREQYWLDMLKPFGNKGYNINRDADSRLGMKHTPESLAKMSASHRGRPPTNLGKKASPETRERLRISHLGNPVSHSAETREKLRLAKLGKKASPKAREKMRKAHLGKPAHNRGEKTTLEICAKISDSNAWRMRTLIVIDPNGNEYAITGIKKFCREHHLSYSHLMDVAKGRFSQAKGWKARYP